MAGLDGFNNEGAVALEGAEVPLSRALTNSLNLQGGQEVHVSYHEQEGGRPALSISYASENAEPQTIDLILDDTAFDEAHPAEKYIWLTVEGAPRLTEEGEAQVKATIEDLQQRAITGTPEYPTHGMS